MALNCKSLIPLALTALLLAGEAQAYLFKEFRSWNVSCTNGLTCTASYSDWDNKNLNRLAFRRSGKPSAPVEFLLPVPPGFDQKGDPNGHFSFVDNKVMVHVKAADLQRASLTSEFILSNPTVVDLFLGYMKAGKELKLEYRGDLGNFTLNVPLAGVSASLLFFDEAQDRLQRVDALQAKGDRPVPADFNLSDITAFEQLPETIRQDFTNDAASCASIEPSALPHLDGFDVTVGEFRMIAMPCGTGGAYNQPYAIYSGFDDTLERMSFPVVSDEGPTVMTTAYNLDYDPRARTITSFFRGRGIGDCGSWFKWKLGDGESSAPAPVLLESRRKDDCDENNMGGPEHFPLVWPKGK